MRLFLCVSHGRHRYVKNAHTQCVGKKRITLYKDFLEAKETKSFTGKKVKKFDIYDE